MKELEKWLPMFLQRLYEIDVMLFDIDCPQFPADLTPNLTKGHDSAMSDRPASV